MLKPQLASPTNRESYVRIKRCLKAKTNTLFKKEINFQYRAQASLTMLDVCPEDIQKMTEKRGNHRFGVLVRGSSCQKHFNLPHNTLDHRLGIDCSAYVDSPSLVILITCLFVYPVQSNGYT